ncbi:MAG: hypothetical protein ACRC5C_04865, partial [Bacilli bacterium]
MRELEAYPDLELPTYDELVKALPGIDCLMTKYENRTNALYVDPDFYVATGETFRDIFYKMKDERGQMNTFDQWGMGMTTISDDTENIARTTQDMMKAFEELEEDDDIQPVDWWAKYQDEVEEKAEAIEDKQTKVFEMAAANKKELPEEIKKVVSAGFGTFPTKEEWKKLFPNHDDSKYTNLSTAPNPTGEELDAKIRAKVKEMFGDHIFESALLSANNLASVSKEDVENPAQEPGNGMPGMYNGAEKWTTETGYRHFNAVYMTWPEFYKSYFHMTHEEARGYARKKIEEGLKKNYYQAPDKSEILSSENMSKIIGANTQELGGIRFKKYPYERVVSMLKSFVDVLSGWQHTDAELKPKMNTSKTRVGLCQVDISKVENADEVKRLAYNWEYNLDKAFQILKVGFSQHSHVNEKGTNFGLVCRRFDQMFYYYELRKAPQKVKDLKNSSLYNEVKGKFTKYRNPFMYYDGFSVQGYVSANKDTFTEEQKLVMGIGLSKDKLKKALRDYNYIDVAYLQSLGIKAKSDTTKMLNKMDDYYDTLTEQQLSAILNRHLNALSEIKISVGVQHNTPESIKEMKNFGMSYSNTLVKNAQKTYSPMKEVVGQQADYLKARRLLGNGDINEMHRRSFYDLITKDHRGRLLRAFPTFQMFIIEEGDEFGKYRFWDNMYGYNAVESIEVHKSRKIAADTAIIELLNVYNNLTTRRSDVDYLDRELSWWDQYIWNELPNDLIEERKKRTHREIYLQTGARIHLRMGYGSNVRELPVMFNGTITEMETGETVQIVAQGDGLELSNIVSADPDDDNDHLFYVQEPRDLLCSLMSTKGNWLKNFMYEMSDGRIFRRNPSGIAHFGQPFSNHEMAGTSINANFLWYNDDYGEVAQNIYSSNGSPTYSQWVDVEGNPYGFAEGLKQFSITERRWKLFNPGDERNVALSLYNQTVWDVAQILAYTTPDYFCMPAPFETRSTLCFGKPYWNYSFGYDYQYEFDEASGKWVGTLLKENRKPYMQYKHYNSLTDICHNGIKASEENVFTVAVVQYDGKQTLPLYADADIRFDKQKTRVIEANIISKMGDTFTSRRVAEFYGMSALRDSLKDMYQGEMVVLGDPTAKPYDMMNIYDTVNQVDGPALIKAVTHSLSMETGFTTNIQPDCITVADDIYIPSSCEWWQSKITSILSGLLAKKSFEILTKRLFGKYLLNEGKAAGRIFMNSVVKSQKISNKALDKTIQSSAEFKRLMRTMDVLEGRLAAFEDDFDMVKYKEALKAYEEALDAFEVKFKPKDFYNDAKGVKFGQKAKQAFQYSNITAQRRIINDILKADKIPDGAFDVIKMRKAISFVKWGVKFSPVGIIANLTIGAAISMVVESLFEKWRRFKQNLSCVTIIPLHYRGAPLLAGVNGHAGLIYGDPPGKIDRFFNANFRDPADPEVDEMWGVTPVKVLNLLTDMFSQFEPGDANLNKSLGEVGNQIK